MDLQPALRVLLSAYFREILKPDVLRLADVDRPVPRDDEVLVRIHATTVNRTDVHVRAAEPFVVRDIRGYNLFVCWNDVENQPLARDPASGIVKARFSFDAALQGGDYSITLRLEDHVGERRHWFTRPGSTG